MIKKVTIIGTGNVASHLAHIFSLHGITIHEIYSKTFTHAKELAQKVNAKPIENLTDLSDKTDLIVLAIKDDLIEEVSRTINKPNIPIVHTSGSVTIDVFKNHFNTYGSLYPLQTFSKGVSLDYDTIPWCLESNNEAFLNQLKNFSRSFTENINEVSSEQRLALHTAAVFACNFTNAMLGISEDVCTEQGVSFNLLKPLIEETLSKSLRESPNKVQTGPAIRKDRSTMQKHEALLSNDQREIYRYLSELIIKKYHDETKL